jgi:hypothetical protein
MYKSKLFHTVVLFLFSLLLMARPVHAGEKQTSSNFTVEFSGCVESIGVGLIPTSQAQALIPPGFHLVGEGQPFTPIVVRTSHCRGIAVDGHKPKPGTVVQIGAVIIPPDFTGDINNYTLWYYTSDAKLAERLSRQGVNAQHVPTLDYDYQPGDMGSPGALHVNVPMPGTPRLSLEGSVLVSPLSAGSFEANWWVGTCQGSIKMNTLVPDISIGNADLILTTPRNDPLGSLFGGSALGFPILQQFNTFPNAHMKVSLVSP